MSATTRMVGLDMAVVTTGAISNAADHASQWVEIPIPATCRIRHIRIAQVAAGQNYTPTLRNRKTDFVVGVNVLWSNAQLGTALDSTPLDLMYVCHEAGKVGQTDEAWLHIIPATNANSTYEIHVVYSNIL